MKIWKTHFYLQMPPSMSSGRFKMFLFTYISISRSYRARVCCPRLSRPIMKSIYQMIQPIMYNIKGILEVFKNPFLFFFLFYTFCKGVNVYGTVSIAYKRFRTEAVAPPSGQLKHWSMSLHDQNGCSLVFCFKT